jgi:ATP-dependent RNA helicase DeaD
MVNFDGVVPALSQALDKRGYTLLTPVQLAVLTPELKNVDALVSAQTGSGKTVAFGLSFAPTLLGSNERFGRAEKALALIVAPTRELALQVKRELDWLYEKTGASIASCVGGMDMRTERRALERGVHIVVGTPGRLRDHIERGSLELTQIKAVVLDEADEMLDLGFRDDLEYILGASPDTRRTLMFSATVPRSIVSLAKRYQRNAVRVEATSEREQHLDIEYQALTVAPNDRENAIINLLRFHEAKNTLVFCATRATVNHMTSRLNNRGFSVVALSGELSQNERTHALQAMRDGRARVCVATDVAARGIDLPSLDLVIHADIPRNSEALLHRSGRTGRAGRKGVSALVVPHNARRKAERLLSNANIKASWIKPPSVEDIEARDRERIFEDKSLVEPLSEEEKVFAQDLLNRHSAEQVAAAFLRRFQSDNPAPEELLDTGTHKEEVKQPRREDFKKGVWFSMTVGRKDHAEARWLLPMLCRAGHITNNEIGAIRIQQSETYVELLPDCVDKFLEALGPSCKIEKNIGVTRLKGIPDMPKEISNRLRRDKKPYERKKSECQDNTVPYKGKPDVKTYGRLEGYKPKAGPKFGGKKKFVHNSNSSIEKDKLDDHSPHGNNPKFERKSVVGPVAKRPWDEDGTKLVEKTPKKKNKSKNKNKKPVFRGLSAKSRNVDKSGSVPLQRKKPLKPKK